MKRPDSEKSNLNRTIIIKYSSLDSKREYRYELQQVFEPNDNQWRDTFEKAD